MRSWLNGDLSGIDLRKESALLARIALEAAERDEPLQDLWEALAQQDLLTLAELATGPRAVAHPTAVEASLALAWRLEEVVPPSGLYRRLVDLAPGLGPAVLQRAAQRHPTARWLARLSRRFDPVPGRLHLLAVAPTELRAACETLAAEGLVAGLVSVSSELSTLEPALALLRRGHVEACQEAAAAAWTSDPTLPLVPWLAAVWGPEPGPLLAGVARRVRDTDARAQMRLATRDLAEVQEVLA